MKSLLLVHPTTKLATLHFAFTKLNHANHHLVHIYRDSYVLSKSFYIKFKHITPLNDFIYVLQNKLIIEESILRNVYTILLSKDTILKYLLLYFATKWYTFADKIFLRSAFRYELFLKFEYVLKNKEYRQKQTDLILELAVACYIAAITNVNLYNGLKTTASSITQTAAANTATLGIESAIQVVGNAVAGAAITAVIDVVVTSATIYVAKRQKDNGTLSQKEFSTKVKKTVFETSCKFVGGTTGSIIGQVFIPVPVFGAFVGGFCGSLIGAGIGKGINYGVFDRSTKKEKEIERVEASREEQQHLFLYKRSFHGYVPKITCYNESEQVFFTKTFERTTKNYLKHEVIKSNDINISFKPDDQPSIKPFIDRIKRKSKEEEITGSEVHKSTSESSKNIKTWKSTFDKIKNKSSSDVTIEDDIEAENKIRISEKNHNKEFLNKKQSTDKKERRKSIDDTKEEIKPKGKKFLCKQTSLEIFSKNQLENNLASENSKSESNFSNFKRVLRLTKADESDNDSVATPTENETKYFIENGMKQLTDSETKKLPERQRVRLSLTNLKDKIKTNLEKRVSNGTLNSPDRTVNALETANEMTIQEQSTNQNLPEFYKSIDIDTKTDNSFSNGNNELNNLSYDPDLKSEQSSTDDVENVKEEKFAFMSIKNLVNRLEQIKSSNSDIEKNKEELNPNPPNRILTKSLSDKNGKLLNPNRVVTKSLSDHCITKRNQDDEEVIKRKRDLVRNQSDPLFNAEKETTLPSKKDGRVVASLKQLLSSPFSSNFPSNEELGDKNTKENMVSVTSTISSSSNLKLANEKLLDKASSDNMEPPKVKKDLSWLNNSIKKKINFKMNDNEDESENKTVEKKEDIIKKSSKENEIIEEPIKKQIRSSHKKGEYSKSRSQSVAESTKQKASGTTERAPSSKGKHRSHSVKVKSSTRKVKKTSEAENKIEKKLFEEEKVVEENSKRKYSGPTFGRLRSAISEVLHNDDKSST